MEPAQLVMALVDSIVIAGAGAVLVVAAVHDGRTERLAQYQRARAVHRRSGPA